MKSQSTLIIAAHPDDEVLGCGGTIAKLADQGCSIHVAFLSDGVFSRDNENINQHFTMQDRQNAAKKSCDILGVKSISFSNFPDNRMDTVGLLDIIKTIEVLIYQYQPDTVFTHHFGDLNIDHQLVHQATMTACRPQIGHSVKTMLCFEVNSSTEWQMPHNSTVFMPNWFVDISNSLDRKLEAFSMYSTELRPWPHPRSQKGVEHLARWRGAMMGMEAAEAFMLCRKLV